MKASKITFQRLYDQGVKDSKDLTKRSGIPLRTVQRDQSEMKKGNSWKEKLEVVFQKH